MDNSSGVPTAVYVLFAMFLAFSLVFLWADVRIIQRAGYSGWWILIGLVPWVNIVMFLVFAFKEWPIQRDLALMRAELASRRGNPAAGYGYPPTGYGDPRFGYHNPTGGYPDRPGGYPDRPGGYGDPPAGYGYPPSGPDDTPAGPPPNG